MSRRLVARVPWLVGLSITALLSCPGCLTPNPEPPPEAVLEGTWELITEQSTNLTQTLLTFDSRGDLTQIRYKIGNVTITNDRPSATTQVDGDNVTIVSSFATNALIFNGTLNEDKTVITGQAGTEIRIGGITISVDNGAMTLTKQD